MADDNVYSLLTNASDIASNKELIDAHDKSITQIFNKLPEVDANTESIDTLQEDVSNTNKRIDNVISDGEDIVDAINNSIQLKIDKDAISDDIDSTDSESVASSKAVKIVNTTATDAAVVANNALPKDSPATSAHKITSASNISLTGEVSGSGDFDGSTDIEIDCKVNVSDELPREILILRDPLTEAEAIFKFDDGGNLTLTMGDKTTVLISPDGDMLSHGNVITGYRKPLVEPI